MLSCATSPLECEDNSPTNQASSRGSPSHHNRFPDIFLPAERVRWQQSQPQQSKTKKKTQHDQTWNPQKNYEEKKETRRSSIKWKWKRRHFVTVVERFVSSSIKLRAGVWRSGEPIRRHGIDKTSEIRTHSGSETAFRLRSKYGIHKSAAAAASAAGHGEEDEADDKNRMKGEVVPISNDIGIGCQMGTAYNGQRVKEEEEEEEKE